MIATRHRAHITGRSAPPRTAVITTFVVVMAAVVTGKRRSAVAERTRRDSIQSFGAIDLDAKPDAAEAWWTGDDSVGSNPTHFYPAAAGAAPSVLGVLSEPARDD